LRIEKPLFSYDQLMWLAVGGVGLIVLMLVGWRLHRRQ
jgi:hypothetical protein